MTKDDLYDQDGGAERAFITLTGHDVIRHLIEEDDGTFTELFECVAGCRECEYLAADPWRS